MTIGSGLGAPLAGFAADRCGPGAAYLAAGAVGIGLAIVAAGMTLAYGSARGQHASVRNTGAPVPADTLVD